LGGRYGSVHPTMALSYTELEYDYAVSKDIPVFAVVISDSALDEKVKSLGKSVLETDHPQELKLFRAKVLSRMSSFFKDNKDIKLAVHETLSDFLSRHDFKGWVSGTELAESSALIEELSQLRKRYASLEMELTDLKKNGSKSKPQGKWEDAELDEIMMTLQSIEVQTPALNSDGKSRKFSVLAILSAMRDGLITGVTNQYGSTDISKLLYYNVCPKLEVHGLATIEKVPGVVWQRYRLTPKGLSLIAHYDKAIKRRQTTPKKVS
jgi:hypothetical protein